MKEMTGVERVLTTLNLQEPDTVPTMDYHSRVLIDKILPGASYEDAEARGEAFFILAENGNSITGKWRSESDPDWAGDWNLVRQ